MGRRFVLERRYRTPANERLPRDAERLFASRMGATTIEVPSSHVAMVSHPAEVTQLITTAAGTSVPPAP
jgi:hypothetical protein